MASALCNFDSGALFADARGRAQPDSRGAAQNRGRCPKRGAKRGEFGAYSSKLLSVRRGHPK